jgi:hypothetical protein
MKIGVIGEGGKILLQFSKERRGMWLPFSSSSLKFSLNARKENRRIRRRRVMKMSGIGEGAE